jgi:hypothetical protein
MLPKVAIFWKSWAIKISSGFCEVFLTLDCIFVPSVIRFQIQHSAKWFIGDPNPIEYSYEFDSYSKLIFSLL